MNTKIAIHVFAALQGLEKSFDAIKAQVQQGNPEHEKISAVLPKQQEILIDMRRTANLLQLHLAKKDWSEAVRSLKIFYGLNQLVRPDILQAFAVISAKSFQQTTQVSQAPVVKEPVYH